MQCVERFEQIYHREPADTVFCPYRICPMEMPGSRYDIGNLESYETVQREYKGLL